MIDAQVNIENLIDESKTCILSSVDHEGFPNSKAMLGVRLREGIQVLYFSTNTSSLKVKQFKSNNKACIYFYDSRLFQGVMFKGVIEVLEDLESKKNLWQDGDTMYYPLGVSDPDYCVLKFTVSSGRYYSDFKSEDFSVQKKEN